MRDPQSKRIIESSAALEYGHYSSKLPFKEENMPVPNNFSVVKQRILGLTRRFLSDEQFYDEYKTYLNDMVSKGKYLHSAW